ncbi:hypothetical protein Tco_0651439 [Tanacetum coccineum]|uniref:Uncharacterized protein n=1 Tax=Tanacetum coccineum TaxID=301880 RepID=A0ABQ4WV20_9ASTR
MWRSPNLMEDKEGKAVNPSHYRGVGVLKSCGWRSQLTGPMALDSMKIPDGAVGWKQKRYALCCKQAEINNILRCQAYRTSRLHFIKDMLREWGVIEDFTCSILNINCEHLLKLYGR